MQLAYAQDTESDRPAIEVRALRKVYRGGVEAVKGIDFVVAPGEVFGLLGPNGAGKSTTIGMLTTTVVPTSGSARLAGYDVVNEPRKARSVSSVVFQEAVVDGGLSGRANLNLHAQLWGVPAATAATRINELIDRPVESFSGGQRRRLEIARALVSQPQVLFLDEPTVGLDPRIRHELLDVIAGLRSRHDMTILLTTHYLDEAQQLCDRVAIIHQGEIVALDTPATLLAGLGAEILELRVDGDGDAALTSLSARGIATANAFAIGSSLTIALDGRPAGDTIAAITDAGVKASGFTTRPPTLDDVYLRLTGAQIAEAA